METTTQSMKWRKSTPNKEVYAAAVGSPVPSLYIDKAVTGNPPPPAIEVTIKVAS